MLADRVKYYQSGMRYQEELIYAGNNGINTIVAFERDPESRCISPVNDDGYLYHGKDNVSYIRSDGLMPTREEISRVVNRLLAQMNNFTDEQINVFNREIILSVAPGYYERIFGEKIPDSCNPVVFRDEDEFLLETYMQRMMEPHKYHTKNPKSGYVYIMNAMHTDWYKIGVSSDPKKRVQQIGTKMPFDVTIDCSYWVDDKIGIERLWHDFYAPYRINNSEWFHLPRGISYIFDMKFYEICHQFNHEMDRVDCWSYDMGIFPDGTPMTEEQIRAYKDENVIPEGGA